MKENRSLSIKQKYELEEFLKNDTYLKDKKLDLSSYEKYIRSLNVFDTAQITYLIYAYMMPCDEMIKDINYYEIIASPKLNALLFINKFIYKYLTEDDRILTRKEYNFLYKIAINRIMEIRKINKYVKNMAQTKKRRVRVKMYPMSRTK